MERPLRSRAARNFRRYSDRTRAVYDLVGSATDRTAPVDFRRQAASALMHPVTLAALGALLVNDLLFKGLWPGTWIPGKLSDLAWMAFAPPALAYILSFAPLGSAWRQRAAFAAAYAGLPLLYVAFNTFQPVHDAILYVLGFVGGDGPRSPLDPTDSLVIPFALVAAVWVWRRPPLEAKSARARLTLLVAVTAIFASVASSYATNWGIRDVGRTASGTLGAYVSSDFPASGGTYESMDGGLTWTKMSDEYVPLETQEWRELEVKSPSRNVFTIDVAYAQIITSYGASGSRDVVYSYENLRSSGNRWMQALDKIDIEARVIATEPLNLFYDDQSGNLIVAMGIQGVVVVAPDGTSRQVAVGRYSPTDFSFGSKARTFFASLLLWETAPSTGVALLLTISFAALALPTSAGPRLCFALAAANSAFLALSLGVYPHALHYPWESGRGMEVVGNFAFLLSGFGLFPLLLVVFGLAFARISRRQLLTVVAASIGMLPLIALGALILFETGTTVANFVAVGLVGLATLSLWIYQKRAQT